MKLGAFAFRIELAQSDAALERPRLYAQRGERLHDTHGVAQDIFGTDARAETVAEHSRRTRFVRLGLFDAQQSGAQLVTFCERMHCLQRAGARAEYAIEFAKPVDFNFVQSDETRRQLRTLRVPLPRVWFDCAAGTVVNRRKRFQQLGFANLSADLADRLSP